MKKQFNFFLALVAIFFNYPQFLDGQYTKVEEIMLFATRLDVPVIMDVQKSEDKIIFSVENKSYFQYDFKIKFSDLHNLTPPIFEHNTILHRGKNRLFVLNFIDKDEPVRYQYTIEYKMSNPNFIDLSFPYLIPIGAGKTVKLDTLKEDNALIILANHFKTGYKDTVFAARKGTVTALPGDKTEVERIIKPSSLEILHSDGTIAIYMGLDQYHEFLQLGQIVYPGQPIGIIGADETLIFQLLAMQENNNLKGLEINFAGQNGQTIPLKSINSKKVFYPENVIQKEMTAKEIKKYRKGELF